MVRGYLGADGGGCSTLRRSARLPRLGTKKKTAANAAVGLMEAQGIEPWSESASRTASTCVGGISCRRRGPVTSRPSRSLSPSDLTSGAGASREASPDLRFGTDAPDGLQMPKEREASLAQLTQPLPVQCWQIKRSKRFSQGPGPGHAAIPSTNPSKPVAPVGLSWKDSGGRLVTVAGPYPRAAASTRVLPLRCAT